MFEIPISDRLEAARMNADCLSAFEVSELCFAAVTALYAAEARAAKAEAERNRLREAAQAAQAWIADGGHVDDDDVRSGGTGARAVYEMLGAVLSDD